MNLPTNEQLVAFRKELRNFVLSHKPAIERRPGTRSPELDELDDFRAWCAALFDAKYLGADWPVEWGGRSDHHPLHTAAVEQALRQAGAPRPVGAWSLVAWALIDFGDDEQRARILPSIRRFEHMWCQLFSEPDAGSDLASLSTRATRTDGGWVVNGQKVWSTHAHVADRGFMLVRTDPEVSKHAGITAMVLDMGAKGVEVRPLREITGSSDFNEVFLDDVFVPDSDVVGEPGNGWTVAQTALSRERSDNAREDPVVESVTRLRQLAENTLLDGRPATADPGVRRELATLHAKARVCDLLGERAFALELAGIERIEDAPISKVFYTELNLEIAEYAIALQEGIGTLTGADVRAVDGGTWQDSYLFARGFTIAGGSNEIMRNIIAERALGLPREPKPAST